VWVRVLSVCNVNILVLGRELESWTEVGCGMSHLMHHPLVLYENGWKEVSREEYVEQV